MCRKYLTIRQVRQRHRRRAPTGKVSATKERKEKKEQTEQDQIRQEVGEGTSKKKVHKTSREQSRYLTEAVEESAVVNKTKMRRARKTDEPLKEYVSGRVEQAPKTWQQQSWRYIKEGISSFEILQEEKTYRCRQRTADGIQWTISTKISFPKHRRQNKAIEKQIGLPEVQQNANFQEAEKLMLPRRK